MLETLQFTLSQTFNLHARTHATGRAQTGGVSLIEVHPMHDAILYLSMFHAVAALELFAIAAIQACLPAPRRNPRFMWIAEALTANTQPDASNWDFAESYDEAA